jgi:hypothetical protein
VVVDGIAGRLYDGILTIRGGRIVFDSPDILHFLAAIGKGIFLVEYRAP